MGYCRYGTGDGGDDTTAARVYYSNLGYIVHDGETYGVHLMLYRLGRGQDHAPYVHIHDGDDDNRFGVYVIPCFGAANESEMHLTDLLGTARVLEGANKVRI